MRKLPEKTPEEMFPRTFKRLRSMGVRICRNCGCTDDNACLVDDGNKLRGCYWVERDLCSVCAGEDMPA